MGHEVVDGCSRLRLLQPLIKGDGAAECIHHPNLEAIGKTQSLTCIMTSQLLDNIAGKTGGISLLGQ